MKSNHVGKKNLRVSNIINESFKLFFKNPLKISIPIFFMSIIITVTAFFVFSQISKQTEDIEYNSPSSVSDSDIIFDFDTDSNNFKTIDKVKEFNNNNPGVLKEGGLAFSSQVIFPFLRIVFPIFGLSAIIVLLITTLLGQFATIRSSDLYLKKNPKSILQIFKEERNQYFLFMFFLIIVGIIISIGFTLFIVPGILLSLALIPSIPIFIIEKKSIIHSLKRSLKLSKGIKGNIFIIVISSYLLIQVMVGLIILFILLFSAILSIFISSGVIWRIILAFFIIIILTIELSLIFAVIISIYYNILKDKEGFATQDLAKSFMSETAATELI